MSGIVIPSYKAGFASPQRGRMKYPQLWRNRLASFDPGLGSCGLLLQDHAMKNNATYGTLPSIGATEKGLAWSLNGSTDYAAVPNMSHLSSSGPQYVSAWFRLNADPTSARSEIYIIGQTSGSYYSQINMGFNIVGVGPSEGSARLCVMDYGVAASGAYTTQDFASDRNWHHAMGGWTGSAWRIWVDGKEDTNAQGIQDAPTNTGFSTQVINIGRSPLANRYFNGHLRDICHVFEPPSQSVANILSLRPGIAYETAQRRSYKAAAASGFRPAWASQRTQMIGGGNR